MKISYGTIVAVTFGIGESATAVPIANVSFVSRDAARSRKCVLRRIERNAVDLRMRLCQQLTDLLLHGPIISFSLDMRNDVAVLINQITVRPDIRMISVPD